MRGLIKYVVGRTYRPLLVKYLSNTRNYRYRSIRLQVPPEVFHPGFFSSTKLLLKSVAALQLTSKNFLELGAGSGLISIFAVKQGATVTASDINPVAVNTLKRNRALNRVEMTVYESDLFSQIPRQTFDVIAINPPYYKKNPQSEKDFAWYCGENGEYFARLFTQLKNYLRQDTTVLMVLCDGCDLAMITRFATSAGFHLRCIATHQSLIEKNFIYQITSVGA